MGLKSDIEKVFLESMGNPEDKGNIPQMAEGIANAIIDFLTKQTFTITEMKSILEVEEISTTGPLQGDVLPSVLPQPHRHWDRRPRRRAGGSRGLRK